MSGVVQQYPQANSMQYDFDSMQYDFDPMSLNFGHHCGALEPDFLDHTSFDVAKTPSSRTTDMTSDMDLNERRTNIYATVSSESTPVVYVIDEGESTTAREHPLYQTDCTEEGFYICPVVNCSHQPEKLKCLFDKHIDSHVKSYRCRESSCVTKRFSSAACKLRHERETHGKHGHGKKPHLCAFLECDRSVPGNGFPRHWNRSDHMKRVHDYDEAASSNGSELSTISSANSFDQDTGTLASRRRRTSSASRAKPRKQTKSSTSKLINASKGLAASTSYEKQRLFMEQQWLKQKVAVKDCLDRLNPDDTLGWEKINNDYAVLQVVGLGIRRQLEKVSHTKCAPH